MLVAVLRCVVSCCGVVLCCVVWCCADAVFCCAVLCSAVLCCAVLFCSVLRCFPSSIAIANNTITHNKYQDYITQLEGEKKVPEGKELIR